MDIPIYPSENFSPQKIGGADVAESLIENNNVSKVTKLPVQNSAPTSSSALSVSDISSTVSESTSETSADGDILNSKDTDTATNSVSEASALISSTQKRHLPKRILSISLTFILIMFSLIPIYHTADSLKKNFSTLSFASIIHFLFSAPEAEFFVSNTISNSEISYSQDDIMHLPFSERLQTYETSSGKVPHNIDINSVYSYTSADIPSNCSPIRAVDLSVKKNFGLSASNQTDYDVDLNVFAEASLSFNSNSASEIIYGNDAPRILIVHTHGTESYAENDGLYYASNDNCRTKDTSRNVVAVGAVMAEYFNRNGIPTIHCTEMFDAESYNKAYSYSEAAIREYTSIYPSIEFVFDVHRDSLVRSDMTKLRPVTVVDGKLTAQYMCVIGTDERAGTHTYWKDNLTFACHLQKALNIRSESLTRRMSLRSASYNQKYARGSLLFEIGSCGNTLEEAKNCALIVAEEITKIIKEQ